MKDDGWGKVDWSRGLCLLSFQYALVCGSKTKTPRRQFGVFFSQINEFVLSAWILDLAFCAYEPPLTHRSMQGSVPIRYLCN